jgi:NADH-quinone oxidoreductase subunit A
MFLSLFTYLVVTLALVGSVIALSYVLGERHRAPATGESYEAGIVSAGSARIRLSAQFYLVAMAFVVFDVEAVFIFAWAVAVPELGWRAYGEILLFIAVLLVALVYLVRLGVFRWGKSGGHPTIGGQQ